MTGTSGAQALPAAQAAPTEDTADAAAEELDLSAQALLPRDSVPQLGKISEASSVAASEDEDVELEQQASSLAAVIEADAEAEAEEHPFASAMSSGATPGAGGVRTCKAVCTQWTRRQQACLSMIARL